MERKKIIAAIVIVLLAALAGFFAFLAGSSGGGKPREALMLDTPSARAATRRATTDSAPAQGPDIPRDLRQTVAKRIELAALPWSAESGRTVRAVPRPRLMNSFAVRTPPADPLVSLRAQLEDDARLLEWLGAWQADRAVHRGPSESSLEQLKGLIMQSPIQADQLDEVGQAILKIDGQESKVAAVWSAAIAERKINSAAASQTVDPR